MGRIFAHSGAHGTGKTTAVFRQAHEFKLRYPELRVGIVHEVARFCPYPINKKATAEAQSWIFARHMERELTALANFDLVVSDRPIFDCVAYTVAAGFLGLAGDMIRLAEYHSNHYERIVFHPIAKSDFLYDDGVREADDTDYQQRIEDEILRIYERLQIKYEDFER